jgi:LytR cell envelope-related transcriptional attenuator
VDHSFAAPADLRPWRATALVASAFAAAELVLLVVVGAVLIEKPLHHASKAVPVAERTAAPVVPHHRVPKKVVARPLLSRRATSVLVLNGNGVAGAAASAAARVHGLGYVIGGVGNATRPDTGRSVIMYRAGFRPEALRLGRDLHVGAVGPLDGLRTSDLMGAHLAYVVG